VGASLISESLMAHPHVFIDNSATILFDERGFAGVEAEWIFDEMFSGTIIQDFDKNKDGKFSDAEIKEIEEGAFSNLENHDYFTRMKIDGKSFKVKQVKNFTARIAEENIIYNFLIQCHVKSEGFYKEVEIAFYDDTYFVQMLLKSETPVAFRDTNNIDFTYEIFDNEEDSYYYGQIFPETILLKFRSKK
jgi:ABC-type uncharacterized transport system substrate-binding protein